MNIEDVQPPEFIIDGMAPGGRIQKVPFLYQREGETWNQFCARMKRVADALNNDIPPAIGRPFLRRLPVIILVGLALWAAVFWMILR